ncbi:adenylate/guanylate cyclase domain-containing protein [Argonema antarcticum]|uniref:adenylate/guanylate cyclase domain-containing protein n=1 Tax=Argonema antarcticum TaxID=2942763 RepID=UPI0020113E1F|nr:adenylate/guanylate cyclase domain-containing protein [Argonema antarcticum]MCL1475458.1 PAS domain S-box protein [Argonema antarcticum A004/B2]
MPHSQFLIPLVALTIGVLVFILVKRRLREAVEQAIGNEIGNLKAIQAKLQESEQKFRTLYESTIDAVMLLDERAYFFDGNRATLEMFGCTAKEQFCGKRPDEFSPPFQPSGESSAQLSAQNIATAFREGSCRFEWLHRRLDRSEFTAEVWLTAVDWKWSSELSVLSSELETSTHSSRIVLQAVVRDISDRKQAEETLKASSRRLRRQSLALLDLTSRTQIASGDLSAAIQDITVVATDTLEVERASVWLYNEERSAIVCLNLYERSYTSHTSGLELRAVDFPGYFQGLQTERIIAAHDAHTDPRTSEFSANYLTLLGITSMLDAPIRVGGRMVGVICHEHIGPARQWALEEEQFASSLADFVALAMEAASRMKAQEALKKANEELEIRVEERTGVLKETNKQLMVEILERKRSSDALRLSEEKFSKAFRSSPDIITITTVEDGRFIDVNETFLSLLEFDREEVIGHTASDLNIWVNQEDRARIVEMLQSAQSQPWERGSLRNQECEFRKKSGEILVGLLSAEIIDLENQPCLLVVTTDITYRVRMEEALRQTEEKYRTIFENAIEGIFQTLPQGKYISANPALARLYGYFSPADLIANLTNIEQQLYVDPNRRGDFIALMQQNNAVSGFESQVHRQDGSTIWISENARAVRDAEGKLLYYEGIVEDITARKLAQEALRYEQEQTERLLLNILPHAIAQRLREEETTIADSFDESTVLFGDIVGFTELSASIEPVELVELLNEIFSTFDTLTDQHGLEKIKTIGDAYMVVGGLPIPRTDHAEAVAEMALDMQIEINRFNSETNQNLQLRVGINTGPVVAGVIGIKKFSYDLWGDTVNTASRMESHGIPGSIQVTASTYQLLRDKYLFEERGRIPIKGKGEMTTYFLMGRRV